MTDPDFEAILPARFYEREGHELARALLGQIVVRTSAHGTVAGRIVELEVYGGTDDPACHADRGVPTARTRTMFGEPGTTYVYKIYGIYDCFNVVGARGANGKVTAILVRALEPVFGLELMMQRRSRSRATNLGERDLLSGPGKLCQAFDIDRSLDGADLQSQPLCIVRGAAVPPGDVETTPRIGLNPDTCGPSADFQWRYVVASSPFRSR